MIENYRKTVEDFKYEEADQEQIIEHTIDPMLLHVLMYNYNWDDGFEVPLKAIENPCCQLSTALMIFHMADGVEYLLNKDEEEFDEWYLFVSRLYKDIMNNKFADGDILFDPDLSKVQMFKLKKVLEENEYVFIESRGKTDLNYDY